MMVDETVSEVAVSVKTMDGRDCGVRKVKVGSCGRGRVTVDGVLYDLVGSGVEGGSMVVIHETVVPGRALVAEARA